MITLYVFAVAAALLVWYRHRQGLAWYRAPLIMAPFLMMFGMFVYSTWLFPAGSIFIWRYFTPCYLFFCLTVADGIKWAVDTVLPHSTRQRESRIVLVCVAVALGLSVQQAGGWWRDMRLACG